MANAKTPKKIPPAAPATVKAASAPHAAKAKAAPAPARAAVAKTPEDAIVHSAEIVGKPVAEVAEKAAAETGQAAERETAETAKAAEAIATKAAEKTTAEVTKAADVVTEIASRPNKAVAVVAKAAEKSQDDLLKGVVPFIDFSRDNAILLLSAGNEVALGLQKMSLSLIDWSAESCDKGVAASQAMLSAKSVEEVFGLSQSLAQDGFEQLLKESSELSALSSKLIEDTIVPLSGRLVAAAEKLASHPA